MNATKRDSTLQTVTKLEQCPQRDGKQEYHPATYDLRSATFSSRLVAAALGYLHVLSGVATISHGPHGELRGALAVSSRSATIRPGVLRFT